MSFEFEYLLKYPLMGATGFDTDDTLLMEIGRAHV